MPIPVLYRPAVNVLPPDQDQPPKDFVPEQWHPCADLQTYEGRKYYLASVRRWDATGKLLATSSLPFEFPASAQAISAAIEFILLLLRQAKSDVPAKRIVPGYRRSNPGDKMPVSHCITIGEGLTPVYANSLAQSILEIVHGHTNSVWFAADHVTFEYIAFTPTKEIYRGTNWDDCLAATRALREKLPPGELPMLTDGHAETVRKALDQQLAAARSAPPARTDESET